MDKKMKLKSLLKLSDELCDYLETKEGRALLRRAGGFISLVEPESKTVVWAARATCYWSSREEDVAVFHQHIQSVVEAGIKALAIEKYVPKKTGGA